jgi:hypothetical protein
MVFAEHHYVTEKLPPDASDDALRRLVLPWNSERRAPRMDAEIRDRGGDWGGDDRVVVEDQESMRRVIGEGVTQLLDQPASRRATADVEVEGASSSVIEDEPDVEQAVGTTKKSIPAIRSLWFRKKVTQR